jgi:hypothetical protein
MAPGEGDAIEVVSDVEVAAGDKRRKPNMTDGQRLAAYHMLLVKQKPGLPGQLVRGALKEVAATFNVTRNTISALWKRAHTSLSNGDMVPDIRSKMSGKVGRKKKEIEIVTAIKEIPLSLRQNQRSLSHQLKIPRSTLQRRIKDGDIRAHSSVVKPFLTGYNMLKRLKFCVSMLDPVNPGLFQDMMDRIHIDEKWFYITKANRTYYLAPDEAEPHRTCKSKKYITKVMFMAAVARPRWDSYRNVQFDGKIGIFPFVVREPAKRSSINRPAGTLVTKAIASINKDESRKMIIDNVLPAIRAKWPRAWPGKNGRTTILIQQDNAGPHVSGDDTQLASELVKDGFDIKLVNQPPNSPDMNVLDLGWFRAIQSLQHQIEAQNTIDDLINATQKAFEDMEVQKLNNVFLTLQQCMVETMRVGGSNNYKVPHMSKAALLRRGDMPETLTCPADALQKASEDIVHMQ